MIGTKDLDSYKEVIEIYGRLVSKVKRRDYKDNELLIFLEFVSDIINSLNALDLINENINSLEAYRKMLSGFIELSDYEQSNVIAIAKFIYSYKKYFLDKDSGIWTHLFAWLRDYSHDAWQVYNKLAEKLKVFPIDETIL